MKRLLTFILIIAILAGGTFAAYKYYFKKGNLASDIQNAFSNSNSSESTPTPTKETFTYTKTNYFVPVTGFVNKLINISQTDLAKKDKIYVVRKDVELLKKVTWLSNAKFEIVETTEDLVKQMNNLETAIGIQDIDELSFKIKALQLDNTFIFDKTADLEKYSLKFSETLTSDTKTENTANYSKAKLTKIGHTGSLIPARGVWYWVEKKYGGDYTLPFQGTKSLLDTFDFVSATFEAPVTKNGRFCDSCMVLVGNEKFMDGVKYSGIDLFSLGANHMMDAGVEGIAFTQKKLDELGIKHTGASTKNNEDAATPTLVEVNGIKIAFLGFNDTPGMNQWASDNKPGAASISDPIYENGVYKGIKPNEERIKHFLQRAKDLKPDYIFVITHWGHQEYNEKPLPYTKTLADLLTKHGADMILGDHPHIVQEIEFKGDKPVFYSVGNYVFDQMWSIETRQGYSIELNYVGKKLVNIRLHPHQLYLYDKGTTSLLKPEQPEYQQILNRTWSVSNFKTK